MDGIVTTTPEPIYTPSPIPTKEPIPTITPTPTLENKLFEFVFPDGTDEQKAVFSKNALEDYRTVLNVYGIKEEDARMVVSVGKQGYGAGFYYGGKEGVGVGMGIDDFVTDRREVKHEMAHAINHTLFPTYHLWFDEGMAMYASGEANGKGNVGLIDPDKPNEGTKVYSVDDAFKLLKENPERYWRMRGYGGGIIPGHVLGWHLYTLLIREYGMTPEQNRTALSLLNQRHTETGKDLTKLDISIAYETALGINLNPLFDLLKPGIMLLYSIDPKIAGTEGAKINQKIRSEF